MKSVVTLGPEGTYAHQATKELFPQSAIFFAPTISKVISEASQKNIHAVVPFENSTHGIVLESLDMLVDSDLKVTKEYSLSVNHCMAMLPGVPYKDIDTVYSHPQALAQCQQYLKKKFPDAQYVETSSTADGMQKLINENLNHAAAIGSGFSAELQNLVVLDSSIQDVDTNKTLFVTATKDRGSDIGLSSVYIMIRPKEDRIGLLCDILSVFKKRNINLQVIQSRPMHQKIGVYKFFMKLEIIADSSVFKDSVKELEAMDISVQIFSF